MTDPTSPTLALMQAYTVAATNLADPTDCSDSEAIRCITRSNETYDALKAAILALERASRQNAIRAKALEEIGATRLRNYGSGEFCTMCNYGLGLCADTCPGHIARECMRKAEEVK